MSSSNESFLKTIVVAVALSLVCSVLVSASAVLLKPDQEANKAADKERNVLIAAGLVDADEELSEDEIGILTSQIEARVVNLDSGEYADDIDPATFDQRKAAKDPARNVVLDPDADPGRIKTRAENATVYLVKENDRVKTVVLPIHGKGLFSTLYGFLALDPYTGKVVGLKYYEQGETPGLGGEVENTGWLAKWEGKQALGPDGQPRLELVKGGVSPDSPNYEYQIDALSGASMTSRGVEDMLTFWLGENGFGPYLDTFKQARG